MTREVTCASWGHFCPREKFFSKSLCCQGKQGQQLGQVTGAFLGHLDSLARASVLGRPLGASTRYWAASPACFHLKSPFCRSGRERKGEPCLLSYCCLYLSFIPLPSPGLSAVLITSLKCKQFYLIPLQPNIELILLTSFDHFSSH